MTKEIPLLSHPDLSIVVDDIDYSRAAQYEWLMQEHEKGCQVFALSKNRASWLASRINIGRLIYIHVLSPRWPAANTKVCHINGNKRDARRENLTVYLRGERIVSNLTQYAK